MDIEKMMEETNEKREKTTLKWKLTHKFALSVSNFLKSMGQREWDMKTEHSQQMFQRFASNISCGIILLHVLLEIKIKCPEKAYP